jgi:hypothetical protein
MRGTCIKILCTHLSSVLSSGIGMWDIIPLLASSALTIMASNDVVTVTDKWYSMKLCPGLNKHVLPIEDC